MESNNRTMITVEALINVPEDKVWELWTQPEHIMQWNNASDDWHTPAATNDLRAGGRFSSIMAAKDGSFSFDFWGIYDKVKKHQTIAYTMGDERVAEITFTKKGQTTLITEVFEAETENPVEMQQMGWQAILNNFKKYAEGYESKKKRLISPCLWFDGQAKEAAEFYCSVFPNSKIKSASPVVIDFELCGQSFLGLNGGAMFKINPAISFYVSCETAAEVEQIWAKLIENGSIMMPLNTYAWSEKYGWLQDQFGMTWQITVDTNIKQKITPSMLFTEGVHGKGKEAIDFYTSIFKNATSLHTSYYAKGQNTYATEGMVLFSLFTLSGQSFIIMDAGTPQSYTFNEGLSFIVHCDNQTEVDYFWGKLTEGGQESQCAWLKDKFGVSWQIVPKLLTQLLGHPDREKAGRAMEAMLKMRKIDTVALQKAFDGI